MDFRAARIGFFHSSSRLEDVELSFERRKQSENARRWLRAATLGDVETMRTIVKEDASVVNAADNFMGFVSRCTDADGKTPECSHRALVFFPPV